MTIMLYDSVGSTNFMTVYKDSDDPKLFYYAPQFAAVSKRQNGDLNFGARLFAKNPNDPNDGFSVYNFGVTGVTPSEEFAKVKRQLESDYGSGIRLAVISPDAEHPTLKTLTEGIYRNIRCQSRGINLYTDLACSFTVDELLEPDMSQFFQDSNAGWAGTIEFAVRTLKTEFEWKITANWHRVQEHFKSQLSVKYWFVKANLSYETQKLIENDTIKIELKGGTPSQKEKIYTFAEKIAKRLFEPTLRPGPLPGHPSGAAVCFSLSKSRVEENRTSVWEGYESAFEVKPLGMAAYVGDIPSRYFSGFDGARIQYDLDSPDDSLFYGNGLR